MDYKIRKIVIEKRDKLSLVDWSEIIVYKDLLYFLSIRSIKARYAQSILGIGWAVLQPLFTIVVFTVVFGGLAKIGSDGIPYSLFSFSGLVAWNYFSGSLSDSSGILLSNSNMITKVYFPRLILPLSSLISKGIELFIGIIVLALMMIFYSHPPSQQIIYFPVILVLLFIATFGPSILLSAWSLQYRDIKYALSFIVQILMYAAPVVYPISSVPTDYRFIYSINPMVGIVEGFRASVLGTQGMPWAELGVGTITSLLLFVYSLYVFSKLERTFADVV